MTNSSLVTYTKISPNRTAPRNKLIDRITIHCFVGQVTAQRGCEVFQATTRQASCNYVIGYDGSIGLCVDEKDRSWCSSNSANDHRAITFEVASDTTHPYAVTDKAFQKTIDLCEDICRRYGKKRLLWFGDKDKTLAYTPKLDEMVMTVHRWFAAKACPGDYLYERHGLIAEEVTKRLNKEEEEVTYEQWKEFMNQYRKELSLAPVADYAKEAIKTCVREGIMSNTGTPEDPAIERPADFLTRQEAAKMQARLIDKIK